MKFSDSRFEPFIKWLFKWEGTVYENDPDDPGGATKYGIDQRSHPKENIRLLTTERAKEIYWQEYWLPIRADKLENGVAEVVANIAINAGKGRASKWLQQACGAIVDGDIGPKTISLANAMDNKILAKTLLDRTEEHYRSIAKGKLSKFLKGWLNRNNSLREYISERF